MKKHRLAVTLFTLLVLLFGNHIHTFAASQNEELVSFSKQYIGVPYKWGGTTPKGFDCSGFVTYVFKEFGVKLPRTAEEQYKNGEKVGKDELEAGDLVFFATYKKTASHAGIYIGDNQFIHASSSKGVMISALNESYWKKRYLGARRYLENKDINVAKVDGQIGVLKIKKPIVAWERTNSGKLVKAGVLKKGEIHSVFAYDEKFGGQYKIDSELYVTHISAHVTYTPFK